MDIDELATDSEFESDGFDDDYSFCESKQKSSPTKSDLKTLQFASFDSYDTSIMQDLKSEIEDSEGANPVQPKPPVADLVQQHQGDLKRYSSLHEGNRGRRKLIKTHSEPRSSKVPKTLPPWTEKGRSGYVPKRQMSSPSRRRNALKGSKINQTLSKDVLSNTEAKTAADASKYETGSNRDVIKLLLPLSPNSSSSDSVTLTPNVQRSDSASTYLPTQGLNNDLPSKSQQKTHKQLSLPSTQEKRSRLQKQKNFNEEVVVANQAKEKTETHRLTGAEGSTNTFLASSGGLLKPPAISLTGSCEKLATLNASDDLDELTGLKINLNKFAGD